MKGVIFSTDALVAISLALLLLSLIPLTFERRYATASLQVLNYQANDLMNVLTILTVSDVSEKPTVQSLISNGALQEKDLNKTVLDLIGTFWHRGSRSIAGNITREVLEGLTDRCFKLETEGEVIYQKGCPAGDTVAVAFRTASGYEVGKPVAGYIARAWATKVLKNTTEIIPFYPSGSGWRPSKPLEVAKIFYIPNVTLYNATLYISLHFGSDKAHVESSAGLVKFLVNGVQRKNDITWLYLQQESGGGEITTAAFGVLDVTKDLLVNSRNSIEFRINTPFYHAHTHPGMRLILTYSLTQEAFTANTTFRKRFYFDDITGSTGAWSTISFYLPENAKNVSAKLHLNARKIDDTAWRGINTSDVEIYVNSDTPSYADGMTTNLCDNIYRHYCCYRYRDRYYCVRDIVSEKDLRLEFDITNKLINGTNMVAVYFNSYGDTHWGDDNARIYSNPVDDPNNSSYVEVYYELPEPPFYYGEIDITKEKLFGGVASNPKSFIFNITERERKIVESFVHIAQGFSSMMKTYANNILIFVSPAVRAVPESVYIRPSVLTIGRNNITLLDVQPHGSVSPINYILPWSSFEYTYLVRSMVDYGSVFNTSELAVGDAKERLIQQIGEGISATDIRIEDKSIYGIEWLWGPSLFKLSLW